MNDVNPFETSALEYDLWHDRHPLLYQSEILALKEAVPIDQRGLEVGVGTGRFAAALNIAAGIEPANAMALMAKERGIDVIQGYAEHLPFSPDCFDFVLFITTVCFLKNPAAAFKESHRVLKEKGKIIIGFIDKNSEIGKLYQKKKGNNKFYKNAHFMGVDEISALLEKSRFRNLRFYQTLTKPVLTEIERPQPGYGKGSFVVVIAKGGGAPNPRDASKSFLKLDAINYE